MEHRPSESLTWAAAPPDNFTGQVWFGPLSAVPGALDALGVLFAPGARTAWHSHPDGQVLYVVSGAGKVQTRAGETVVVGPGDVVYSPPGELHWHGSTPSSFMMHLSLTTGGATEWTPEMVVDSDYLREPGD